MKRLLVLIVAALLSACAGITKVEGDHLVNSRLSVKLPEAWNKINVPGVQQPYESWTQEGITLDQLRIWAGIRPGQTMMVAPASSATGGQKAPRVPTFTGSMPSDQLVGLFETLFSADGSLFVLNKVEPSTFAGERGIRFEFSLTRKSDGLQMLGTGWVSVRRDELFAMTFVAPKLSFFPRLAPKVDALVKTAQIRG